MIRKLITVLIVCGCFAGCIEKELMPGNGSVRLKYDWEKLETGQEIPKNLVAYFYPEEAGMLPICVEGEQLAGKITLPRGKYKVLTFNKPIEEVTFDKLSDFEQANVILNPVTKSSGIIIPPASSLYGGTVTELQITGYGEKSLPVVMQSYAKHIEVSVEMDARLIDNCYGLLENTAVGVLLKNGKPLPRGNGTTRFELKKTDNGLSADFLIFGVDTSAGKLPNNMHVILQDNQGGKYELAIDVTDKIDNSGGSGSTTIVENVEGIGIVKITVGDWQADEEDNSMTQTLISLSPYVGKPVRSLDMAFNGTYGVYVAKAGQALGNGNIYRNVAITVDDAGNSLASENMYYPLGKVDLYAYAPYDGTAVTTLNRTLVSAANEAELKSQDFLWAKLPGIMETPTALPLHFGHVLSAIRVEVVRGTGVAATDFEQTQVWIQNLVTKAAIDLQTGIATPGNVVPADVKALNTAVTADLVTAEAVIVPQTLQAGKILLRIMVAGNENLLYVYSPDQATVFTAGSRKVIRLTVENIPVSFATRNHDAQYQVAVVEKNEKW